MAGANYMGGRRNTARARTRDVAGRTQKGHFMRQKHQILARGLRNPSLDDKEQRSTQCGRVEEIGFAHARKDLQHEQSNLTRQTSAQPKTPSHGLLHSTASSESSLQNSIKHSKILEELDINEPSGLKATLRRILLQPNLAGLDRANIRPVPLKQHNKSVLTIESFRKRQKKTDEQTSSLSSSSSSFRYDSPTRRGTTNQSLLLVKQQVVHSFSPRKDGLFNSNIHASAGPFSPVAGNSGGDSVSFDSSMDRFSTVQEAGSSSSYPDSGFSELLFTDNEDKGQADSQPDTKELARDGVKASRFHSSSSSNLYLNNNNAQKFMFKKQKNQNLQQEPDFLSPPRHFEPPKLANSFRPATPHSLERPLKQMSQFNNADRSLALDETLPSETLFQDTIYQIPYGGVDEHARYGVGYVPPGPDVHYKPFVPLATMLPSYSDDDSPSFDDEACLDGDTPVEELMEVIEDQTYDSPTIRSQSGCLGSEDSIIMPLPLPSRQPFKTPPRRDMSSPAHRFSSSHRTRFSFPAKSSVCSILGARSYQDQTLPYSQIAPSSLSIRRSRSPMISNSPESPHTLHDTEYRNEEYCGSVEVSQYDSVAVHLDTYAASDGQASSHPLPVPDAQFTYSPDAYQATVFEITDIHRDGPSLPLDVDDVDLTPQVFDGPDLFVGDADDDDDD